MPESLTVNQLPSGYWMYEANLNDGTFFAVDVVSDELAAWRKGRAALLRLHEWRAGLSA